MKLADAAGFFRGEKVERWVRMLLGHGLRYFDYIRERKNRITRFGHIVRDYAKGKPVKAIAEKYGCSVHTVLRYARLAELERRTRSDHRETVIAMLQLGKPYAEISARTGLTLSAISQMAKRNNLHRYKR